MASMTLDEVVVRLGLGMEELKESQMETGRILREFVEQREREAELEAVRRKQEAEQRKQEAEQRKQEDDRRKQELDEVIRKMSERVDLVSENIGRLGGRLGDIIELVVVPGICRAMNDCGHDFDRIVPNMKLRKDGQKYAQVDLMLYNSTEVMAIEIKTNLDMEDVTWHLNRLVKLREIEEKLDIKNRVLYGAVAGVVIDERARKKALDNGLYVIEVQERERNLNVESPEKNKIGKW